ncbi:DUF2272 domain-containing protein [Gammaproteobacteria bacterium LSUCC0112]|nr:DUF2272 domain-containing protein [Gammaproteobacteria bacterium LSUCC0112]
MSALRPILLATMLVLVNVSVQAQLSESPQRLPADMLDVRSPMERVTGTPGNMRITDRSCRSKPLPDLRRRIVDTAAQEWAYFGFSVDKQARAEPLSQGSNQSLSLQMPRGAFSRMSPGENARVASSIAGYWAATPDSDWILQRQNANWNAEGAGARWRNAWSAAFISWVMCESGLDDPGQFRRAIAHHTYIDQAIRAADGQDNDAVYTAFEPGQAAVEPGDLLCRGSRPEYRNLADRRTQLGEGARTHCDIVVKVDTEAQTIMVIGGNVRGTVRMKVLPAGQNDGEALRALSDNGRALFAHLKLQAPSIALNALDTSPTLQAFPSAYR